MTMIAENESLIEEMLEAEKAPEPGTMHIREVLHRGDENVPMPLVIGALASAGYSFIYDTKTGERSLTNRNMLKAQLEKKRDDGSRVFSLRAPKDAKGKTIKPIRGKIKCILHADDPSRAEFDAMGFASCPKDTIPSPFQLRRHMMTRHKVEWATIEEERQRKEKEEERQFQRSVMNMSKAK